MKKNFRKIIAVLMVILMAAVYVPIADTDSSLSISASAATRTGTLGSNIKWSYDSKTKIITVTGSGSMKNYSKAGDGQDFDKIVIGTTQYPNKNAEKIVIGEGITSIGNNAFRDLTGVKTVTLPSSVKTIGDSAFRGCSALTSVNLTESITSIGASAFRDTKFASVNMPYSVTSVGGNAFSGVSGLKITCNYGDAAYNYCVNSGASYTLRNPSLALSASLDAGAKQVKLTVKMNDASGFNAGNLVLTYDSSALTPASPDSLADDMNESSDVTTVIVNNESGKTSIAVMAADCVQYSVCSGKCEYTVAELIFNVIGQNDEASFTVSADPMMYAGERITVANASAKLALHVWADTVTKEATCSSGGEKASVCSICGKAVTTPTAINPNNHSGTVQTQNAKDATCSEEGYTGDKVCSDCGAVIVKGSAIEKLPHDWQAGDTVEPNCTDGGYTKYVCSVCGETKNGDEVPALGHDFGEGVVTPATCTQGGYTTYICARCGESHTADEVPASHSYEAVVTAPTCTEKGFTTYTCSVCGDTYTGDETPALGHDYGEGVVTPATCDKDGYTTYTCSRCGNTSVGQPTKKTDHQYKATVAYPTCTEKGYTTFTCTLCGNSYTDYETSPLGHEYGADGKCVRCGETGDFSAVIEFAQDSPVTVNNENKTVLLKNPTLASELSGWIVSEGWTLRSSGGASLGEDANATTASVIQHNTSAAYYTVIILGDANCDGKVSAADAREVLRQSARLSELGEAAKLAADSTGDGKITAADARKILRVSARLQTFE